MSLSPAARAVRLNAWIADTRGPDGFRACLGEIARSLGGCALRLRENELDEAPTPVKVVVESSGFDRFANAARDLNLAGDADIVALARDICVPTGIRAMRDRLAGRPAAALLETFFDRAGVVDYLVVPFLCSSGRLGAVTIGSTEHALDPDAGAILTLLGPGLWRRWESIQTRPDGWEGMRLTPRERECLDWSSVGKTSFEIGGIIGATPRTVDAHVNAAITKLGATSRTHAVAMALRRGLIG
jgi:DNA-binding CsgD family transcriptional regulator